jgi:molybdopterin converting factor small subunit
MTDSEKMTKISLRYWAGARAAAGVEHEQFEAGSVSDALAQARARRADARFDRVLSVCSVLIDGTVARAADLDRQRDSSVEAEILPPFAGGATGTSPQT